MHKNRDLFFLLLFPGFSVQKISVPRRRTQHRQPGQIAHAAFDGNTIAIDLRADHFLILILCDADHSAQRPSFVRPFGVGYQHDVSLLVFWWKWSPPEVQAPAANATLVTTLALKLRSIFLSFVLQIFCTKDIDPKKAYTALATWPDCAHWVWW